VEDVQDRFGGIQVLTVVSRGDFSVFTPVGSALQEIFDPGQRLRVSCLP
jgi:hypothetical protein